MNNMPYYDVAEDANGRWFVMNENGFPISQAYATKGEATAFQELLKEI
jgi:hypothetical protein